MKSAPHNWKDQRICQLTDDWMVLGDGVPVDDKGVWPLCQSVGTSIWDRVPCLRGTDHADTAVPFERQGEVLISKFPNPSSASCWGSRKARAWGCPSTTGRALASFSGGWLSGDHGRELGS